VRRDRNDPTFVLGPRIRARRHELGLTLKQVALMAGLSHPFLSQVERGLARPSVTTLQRLADALGTTTYMLLAPKAGPVRLVRRGEGVLPTGDEPGTLGTQRALSSGPHRIRAVETRGAPPDWGPSKTTQPGEVLIYVADGCVEAEVAGKRYQLESGDTLVFDGRLPHDVRNANGPETRYLSIWMP
jgi:transcriptional regulator with XRE-family HTH domain